MGVSVDASVCKRVAAPILARKNTGLNFAWTSVSIQTRFGAQHRLSAGPWVADRFLHQKLTGFARMVIAVTAQDTLYATYETRDVHKFHKKRAE